MPGLSAYFASAFIKKKKKMLQLRIKPSKTTNYSFSTQSVWQCKRTFAEGTTNPISKQLLPPPHKKNQIFFPNFHMVVMKNGIEDVQGIKNFLNLQQ